MPDLQARIEALRWAALAAFHQAENWDKAVAESPELADVVVDWRQMCRHLDAMADELEEAKP